MEPGGLKRGPSQAASHGLRAQGQWTLRAFLRTDLVEHEVDDDAARGNENPHRPEYTGDPFMAAVLATPAVPHGSTDEGKHGDCEQDVGYEDGEVEWSGPVVMRVGNGADLNVIGQV